MFKKKNILDFFDKFENDIYWHLIIIILLPLILYLKVINYDFLQDDIIVIKSNYKIIENILNIPEAFKRDIFLKEKGILFYRPIQTATYMIDAVVSGTDPWMYHTTNLILHLATCVALYFLLKFFKFRNLTAFFFSLVFSIHPLLACAVSWIPARADLLSGFLGILILLTFGKYFSLSDETPGKKRQIYFGLNSFLFLLIVFSKETALLFPFVLLFFYLFILRKSTQNAVPELISNNLETVKGKKEQRNELLPLWLSLKDKKLYPFYILWIVIFLIYINVRNSVMTGKTLSYDFGFESFLKNCSVIPIIFGKSFIPINLPLFPLFDNTSIIIGIISFCIIIYLAAVYSKRKKWFVLMGLLWFLLFVIPSLFYRQKLYNYEIIPIEQNIYLPIIGLIIILASFFDNFATPNKSSLIYETITIFLVSLFFSYLAYTHANDYKEAFAYCNSAINKNPNNAGAYTNRGIANFCANNMKNAIDDFNKAIEICNYPQAYYNRGSIKAATRDDVGAEQDFTSAISMDSSTAALYIQRAITRNLLKNYNGAIQDLNTAAKLDPEDPAIYYYRGKLFNTILNYKEAIIDFNKTTSLDTTFSDIYRERALAEFNTGDYWGAIKDNNKIIEYKQEDPSTYLNVGISYTELNKFNEAVASFNKAINMSFDFAPAFFYRGIAKQRGNDIAGACKDWNEALKLGYTQAKEMLDKYCK